MNKNLLKKISGIVITAINIINIICIFFPFKLFEILNYRLIFFLMLILTVLQLFIAKNKILNNNFQYSVNSIAFVLNLIIILFIIIYIFFIFIILMSDGEIFGNFTN